MLSLMREIKESNIYYTIISQTKITNIMASKTAYPILIFSLFFFLSMPNSTIAFNRVSAVFAFGDSTIDAGNNNHLHTFFRGDHLPYGRDFPTHLPTGRFSIGKIPTDYLTQILGIKELLPAFLDPQVTDKDLITGVSFASGGSGLDSNTAALSRVFDLVTQFELFEEALMRIRNVVGNGKANDIVHNALFVISTGVNDILYNDYILPTRVSHYGSISGYQHFLLQRFQSFIQRLYGAGARKIMVVGLPPIGCLPIEVTISKILPSQHWHQRVCNDKQNMDSRIYNAKLQSHIHLLHQTTLHDAKVAYFDLYSLMQDMIISPDKYGFGHSLQGCCGTGFLEIGLGCNSLDVICPDPSKYLFWDAVHPTQKGNWIIANSIQQTVLPYLTS